jgi:nucleotide-binding universal stress UspA family protein
MENARHHAQEAVETARKILIAGNVKVLDSKQAPVGDPRVLTLDHAKEWGADLIVLGSHSRRGLDRMLMGSVSEAVARHAHCSVEVIRPLETSALRQPATLSFGSLPNIRGSANPSHFFD